MELHPQFITRGGRDEYVVLPAEEFEALAAMLEDYDDLQALRTAKASEVGSETMPIDEVLAGLAGSQ